MIISETLIQAENDQRERELNARLERRLRVAEREASVAREEGRLARLADLARRSRAAASGIPTSAH